MSISNIINIPILGLCMITGSTFAAEDVTCPQGFTYIGQAYADASETNAEAKVAAVPKTVIFPKNFVIDPNYRQIGGRWAGGSAGAVMTDADVPNGLHIIASGTTGGAKGWSVHPPQLRVIEEGENNTIIQRGYEMKLYCHTGSGDIEKIGHVSCNVKADICAKPKKKK